MKVFSYLLIFAAVLALSNSLDRNRKKYKVVCYLGSWANYRSGDGKFVIEDIDPFLCTHVVYGFAKLSPENEIAPYDTYLDLKTNYGLGAYERFNKLRDINPGLTTLIAIGGWNEGSTKYSQMASSASTRAIFVKSAVDFCLEYGFDGLDVDWEYPANRGGSPQDKANFVLLLKDLKEAFQPHGLVLSAAVSAGKSTIDTAYDIPNVGKYLDMINIMAYDLHGSWESVTGHQSSLYGSDDENENQKILTVNYAVNYWIKNGAPRQKLVLGMPLYGRSFTLQSASQHGLGAPAVGAGSAGPITQQVGMLGYNEICQYLVNQGWQRVWLDKVDAPYAYNGNQWVGYDDKESLKIKVDYIKKMQLGGGMVWSLETDDFHGKCYGQKYPLLSVISEELNGPANPATAQQHKITTAPTFDPQYTSAPPAQTLPTRAPSTKEPTEFKCIAVGYFRHPTECQKFFYCSALGDGTFMKYEYTCGEGTAFDEVNSVCTYKDAIPGC